MNYVGVMGGIGNQLFQYAFSKHLELITGNQSILFTSFYDKVAGFEGVTNRSFVLDKFGLEFTSKAGNITCSQILNEDDIDSIESGVDNTYFHGYWQDKKYFMDVLDDIKSSFSLNEESHKGLNYIENEMLTENSVSIHVRRGDYTNQANKDLFCELGKDYYVGALETIIEMIGEEVAVYVFSDDITFCKNLFKDCWNYKTVYMSDRKDYEDLYLMSVARHHIIANSTFGWWGSAVSKGGITIAPPRWYKNRENPNLYLDNWIVL